MSRQDDQQYYQQPRPEERGLKSTGVPGEFVETATAPQPARTSTFFSWFKAAVTPAEELQTKRDPEQPDEDAQSSKSLESHHDDFDFGLEIAGFSPTMMEADKQASPGWTSSRRPDLSTGDFGKDDKLEAESDKAYRL